MKNFLANKRTFKVLLGLTLGTGVTYGAYRITENRKIEGKHVNIPEINGINSNIMTKVNNQPENEQKIQQTKEDIKTEQPVEEKIQEKEEAYPKEQAKNEKKYYRYLKEVTQFKKENQNGGQGQVLIVADLPYNQQFQAKILQQINKISSKIDKVHIYKKDFSNKQEISTFEKEYKVKVKDQTIFVLQNNYDRGMNNIDFDMFMQYPTLIEHYLKDVNCSDQQNVKQVVQRLAKLSPHQSTLIYLFDKNEPQQKRKERMLAAKYVQMEMVLNNLYGVKLQVVDKEAAVKANLINPQNSRTNSVHLFRKHNIYTPYDPNFYLKTDNDTQPFHRLADIALFAKGSQNFMVKHYLSNLQTFDAIANPAPFMCTLRVDRNRITDEDYTKLLKIFGQLKRKNKFSDICFSLKLKKIPYRGRDCLPNKQWMITLTNLDEMDKQSMMHQIKTKEQLDMLGFNQKDYLTSSNQYIYEHNIFTSDLIVEFLQKAIKSQLPKYYRSEQENNLNGVRKLVSNQFNASILDDNKDHFVYEYSQFCPTCKKISPIIGSFSKIVQQKGLGLQNLEFHRFNANKNRVKGQLSSPYIPNIFYYKNQWKKAGPVRYPIQMLGTQGPLSLYTFCAITHDIKTIPWANIYNSIASAKKFNWKQFETL